MFCGGERRDLNVFHDEWGTEQPVERKVLRPSCQYDDDDILVCQPTFSPYLLELADCICVLLLSRLGYAQLKPIKGRALGFIFI